MKRGIVLLVLLSAANLWAVDPTNVTGCALWLKADAGVYTNSSGVVTNWVDQAHGISAINSSAAPAMPTVMAN